MKIAFINGSPRGRKATSEWILNRIADKTKDAEITHFYIRKNTSYEEAREALKADALIFAFPNYFGSVPAPLMEFMELIEKNSKGLDHKITVYAIVNCGFYYSSENKIALKVMHNFARKVGFLWGKGIAIGSGGGITIMDKIPPAKLMLIPIYKSLKNLSKLVEGKRFTTKKEAQDNDWYVKIYMTCRFYIFIAQSIWCAKAKKNGLKPSEL